MTWIYENKHVDELPAGCIGFVYCITNNLTNRKYIGKKQATFSSKSSRAKRVLHGIEKPVGARLESDWRSYFGSNNALLKDVEELGEEEFTREILYFAYSKSELTYLEAKEQFVTDCLLKESEYYNAYIGCRINRNNFKR